MAMNTFRGVKPDGTLGASARTQVQGMIDSSTPKIDLSAYAKTSDVKAASGVRRVALNKATTAVDTSAWNVDVPVAVVFTQDATGGRKVTFAGEEIDIDPAPNAATVTAWVHDGYAWVWRSSASVTETAATEPPMWVAGTTVSTGTPTDSSVTFTFSQDIPTKGALQYRAGSSDSWRTISRATARTAVVSGLSASTTYPAFDFQVINSAGASTVLTAQSFTTTTPPPGWKAIRQATFTTTAETPLASYTPEIGGVITQDETRTNVVVTGGQTEVRFGSANYADTTLRWSNLENGDKKLRLTSKYSGVTGGNAKISLGIKTNQNPTTWVNISPDAITPYTDYCSFTETTGNTSMPPTSGTVALAFEDNTATLTINGAVYRKWNIAWNANYGTVSYYSAAIFGAGGGDLHSTEKPVSSVHLSEIKVESWK